MVYMAEVAACKLMIRGYCSEYSAVLLLKNTSEDLGKRNVTSLHGL